MSFLSLIAEIAIKLFMGLLGKSRDERLGQAEEANKLSEAGIDAIQQAKEARDNLRDPNAANGLSSKYSRD